MKKFFTGVFFLFFLSAYSQASEPLAVGHYIVIATYRPGQEALAKKYTESLNKSGAHAKYGYDTPDHYIYVYLDYYADFRESITEMLKTRKENGFEAAWVRVIKTSSDQPQESVARDQRPLTKTEASEPVIVQKETATVGKWPEPVAFPKPVDATATQRKPVDVVPRESNPVFSSGVVEMKEPEEPVKVEETKKASEPKPPMTLANTKILMRFVNPTDNSIINGGEVEFVDAERSRLITTVKGNENALLPDPKSTSGKLILIGNVFGYRKVQHELEYKQFPVDTTTLITPYENSYKIDFEMVRYHKGDTETLYDVFFYNDAAIMLPESKYQLNQLLQMMKDNVEYKIMLHGHTNGNAHGKVITMGPSNNFFALSDDVKIGIGSAKQLSGKRAEVIKEWLIANGVAADRIDAKAWGGSKMLHDKNSVNAKKNVRVEVEVVED